MRINSCLIRRFVRGTRVRSTAVSSTPAADWAFVSTIGRQFPHYLVHDYHSLSSVGSKVFSQGNLHLCLASAAWSVPQDVSSGDSAPVQEAWQASIQPSLQPAEASPFLPSCPEEAVSLPCSQLHTDCQPGTPQQSSESAQSSVESPCFGSEQPEAGNMTDGQQATAGTDGRSDATTSAGASAEQDSQHLWGTGRTEPQSKPGFSAGTDMEAHQHRWMALERPPKSLPAAPIEPVKENTSSKPLIRAWQEVEDSSLPEARARTARLAARLCCARRSIF